jgi:hypothetical protein
LTSGSWSALATAADPSGAAPNFNFTLSNY